MLFLEGASMVPAILSRLFELIAPTTMAKQSNNLVARKINYIETHGDIYQRAKRDIEDLDGLTPDALKAIYERTLEQKDKIEDKAKTLTAASTIATTITVTLITASGEISTETDYVGFFDLVFCALCFLAASYMVIASINTIRIYTSLIKTYTFDYSAINEIIEYKKSIACNRLTNIMRTNFLGSSFQCLKNSLWLLLLTCATKFVALFPLLN